MLSTDDLLSKTIQFLRLPLIVGVVFIHTLNDSYGQFPVYDWTRYLVNDELAHIAVPLFFFMSGFLFFYRTDFSFATYKQKLIKRVHSLLIPYLLWNAEMLVVGFIHPSFVPTDWSSWGQHLAQQLLGWRVSR